MRGGSYASDAVSERINAATFAGLSKNFDNIFDQEGGRRGKSHSSKKKMGGSLASNATLRALPPNAFNAMNATRTLPSRDLQVAGTRTRRGIGCSQCSQFAKCANCARALKGGNPSFASIMANAGRLLTGHPTQTTETFSQSFAYKSEPASVPPHTTSAHHKGGQKGGFGKHLKNINEYMNNGSYRVFNKKQLGGNADSVKVGLNTSESIMASKATLGNAPARVPNETTLNIIANEEINGPMLMNKTSHFGDVTGLVESKTHFKFGGGTNVRKYRTQSKAASYKGFRG